MTVKEILKKYGPLVVYILLYTAFFLWYFIENFEDAGLEYKDIPYMLLFYFALIAVIISIRFIFKHANENSKLVVFEKYQIYKLYKELEEEQKLSQFEQYCVSKNKDKCKEELTRIENVNTDELLEIIEKNNIKEIETYLENQNIKTGRKIKYLLYNYHKPWMYEYFTGYYQNTLLEKKNPAVSVLITIITIILAVLPFFLEHFLAISPIAYLEFLPVLVFEVVELCSTRKDEIKRLQRVYNADYHSVVDEIKMFLDSRD